MPFDWGQYLTLAEDLDASRVPSCSDEARWRAAVSRAYYAVFCRARDHLVSLGALSTTRAEEQGYHQRVAALLSASHRDDEKKVGEWLARMRRARNAADYEADFPHGQDRARDAIRMGRWALERLARLHGG